MTKIACLLAICIHQLLLVNGDSSVHILAANLDQLITSTTLEWVPSNGDDRETLRQAVQAASQTVEEEPGVNEAEPADNETRTRFVQKPVYVCRAKIKAVWISGQLRPKKHVCVVSLYKKLMEHKEFDILRNIENSARLSWVPKNKYQIISQGAVTSGDNPLTWRTFVARKAAASHNKEGSLTYNIGIFDEKENLGVYHVVDQNNIEIQDDEGEILVETEPISYELKNIKHDRMNPARHPKKTMILGETILKNEEDGLQRVDSVISYNYTYSLSWGRGHGLLTGLNLTVTFPNNTEIFGSWGIPQKKVNVEVAPIERYLESGTAVNVTLKGNYTESEIPYIATVVSKYKDGKTREITIRDTKREDKMMDVVVIYSPAYFIHNNTEVPTTTTTTTTTSTTTTTLRSTTTQEISPISPPEVVPHKKQVVETESRNGNQENDSMMSMQENHDSAPIKRKETEAVKDRNGGSKSTISSLALALTTLAVMLTAT